MNSEFVRFPTQDGEFFARPETIMNIQDKSIGCYLYIRHEGNFSRIIEVTCTAAEAIALIAEWQRADKEMATRVVEKYKNQEPL